MEVRTEWATYNNCILMTNRYMANDGLYIEIWSPEEGPIATLTVCLPNESKPSEDEAYIDTNNCPWAMRFISEYGLGEETGLYGFSGYCCYPLVKFNMDKVNEYTYKESEDV